MYNRGSLSFEGGGMIAWKNRNELINFFAAYVARFE